MSVVKVEPVAKVELTEEMPKKAPSWGRHFQTSDELS
jgi:hypothetical protein